MGMIIIHHRYSNIIHYINIIFVTMLFYNMYFIYQSKIKEKLVLVNVSQLAGKTNQHVSRKIELHWNFCNQLLFTVNLMINYINKHPSLDQLNAAAIYHVPNLLEAPSLCTCCICPCVYDANEVSVVRVGSGYARLSLILQLPVVQPTNSRDPGSGIFDVPHPKLLQITRVYQCSGGISAFLLSLTLCWMWSGSALIQVSAL